MNSQFVLRSKPFLAVISALLLTLSYPPFDLGFLAWIALVPFLQSIYLANTKREVWISSFLLGVVFFGFSLFWMNHVHPAAWVLLLLLESFFFMLLGWAIFVGKRIAHPPFWKILWIALSWSAIEFLRSEIPIFGLGWNLLGNSQARFLDIIQFANLFGAYGLGFVIALINALFFHFVMEWRWQLGHGKLHLVLNRFISVDGFRSSAVTLLVIIGILGLLKNYGRTQLEDEDLNFNPVKVSVLQGNIPQDVKWNPASRIKIIEIYSRLTELAAQEKPDLIIWPEAAFPGYFNRDYASQRVKDVVLRLGIPVIIGSPHLELHDVAYNSTYLLNEKAKIEQRYDKQYLVPFGEYVPLKPIFGWLEPLARSLGVSDFSSRKEATVFLLRDQGVRFSTPICFEDVFPRLVRRFVNKGAQFLAVVTNDAWFGDSAAAHQHLQASVMRAVENGVPVVRAANTGVSAFISPKGKVLSRIRDTAGRDLFITGYETLVINAGNPNTFYRKRGWLFPYAVLALFVGMFFVSFFRFKTKRKRTVKKKLRAKKKDPKKMFHHAQKIHSHAKKKRAQKHGATAMHHGSDHSPQTADHRPKAKHKKPKKSEK